MGGINTPDLALTLAVMALYLEIVQPKVNDATDKLERHRWISIEAYLALCFCGLLQGNEGFHLDLYGL